MLINTIKDLDKLMQLARKRGISELTVDGIKFVIDYTQGPVKQAKNQPQLPLVAPGIDTPDLPTEEDLLYYSSGGAIGTGSYQSPAWQVMQAKEKQKAKTAQNMSEG